MGSGRAGRLLVGGKPFPDESLLGYVIRLTEQNVYETPAWILKMAGFNSEQIHQSCAFVFRPQDGAAGLSRLAGVNESELLPLGYPQALSPGRAASYLFSGQSVVQYLVQPARPRLCPKCLSESPYCRRIWDLSTVTVCPVHRCLLINRCPGCKRDISCVRSGVSICRCEFDWRDADATRVEESTLSFVRRIHSLCGPPHSDCGPPTDDTSPVSGLDLDGLCSAVIFIAAQYQGLTRSTGKHFVKERRIAELHGLLSKAYSVFEDWPNNYYRFLEWRRTQEGNAAPADAKLKTGIRKEFGKFHTGLNRYLPSSRHDFMREAFAAYLGKHWDGGYLSSLNRGRGAGLDSNEGRYVSKVKARQSLGIDSRWLEHFIATGRLWAVVRRMGKKRLFLIDAESLADLKAALGRLLGVKDVSAQLGVGYEVVVGLARNGCLQPKRGPSVDGFDVWKFEQGDVTALIEKIRIRVKKARARRSDDSLTFKESVYRCGTSSADFVKAIVDGVIRPSGGASVNGLQGFFFSEADVRLFSRTVKRTGGDAQFPLPSVSAVAHTQADLAGVYAI